MDILLFRRRAHNGKSVSQVSAGGEGTEAERWLSVVEIGEYWVGVTGQGLEERTKTFSLGVNIMGITWYQTPQSSVTSQSREEWLVQQNSTYQTEWSHCILPELVRRLVQHTHRLPLV